MSTTDDVRRIALALPEVTEEADRFAFRVRGKPLCWCWLERVDPKKGRVPNLSVLGVRVSNEMDKYALIDIGPDRFFTEPHYNGYPAILVRLDAIDPDELAGLILAAWRLQAPKSLVKKWEVGGAV